MRRWTLLLALFLAFGCEEPLDPEADTGVGLPDLLELPEDEAVVLGLFTFPSPGQADRTLEELFIDFLDDAPAGSKVRGAFFSFSLNSVAQAMVAAKERGVDIQIVLGNTNRAGSGQEFSSVGTLREGLGEELTICSESSTQGACLGSNIQHNKFLLFSELGRGVEHVVVQSSGNVTSFQQFQYDNMVVFTGDEGLYNAYESYFLDLQADQRDPNYHRVGEGARGTLAYFSPYTQGDPVEEDLQAIECQEGDEVYLAMAFFTDTRVDVAMRLRELDEAGCEVNALLRWSEINSPGNFVWTALRFGNINLGYFPEQEEIQLHHKYLVYRAHHAGSDGPVSVVWTGSHNYTRAALQDNDEVLLRIEDEELFEAFREDWQRVRERAETRWPN